MTSNVYEINCMMCGTEVGEVRDGRFVHHSGCQKQPAVRGGFLRCCRCDGSLYRERVDNLLLRNRGYSAPRLDLARAG